MKEIGIFHQKESITNERKQKRGEKKTKKLIQSKRFAASGTQKKKKHKIIKRKSKESSESLETRTKEGGQSGNTQVDTLTHG